MSFTWVVVAGLVLAPTSVVSVSSAGQQGNSSSTSPAVSADGRFVAFESSASNLVPGDTNGVTDVFVRDRRSGVTERVSLTGAGGQLPDHSYSASVSADGRYVTFVTAAPAPDPSQPHGPPLVYVRDRRAGTTELICQSTAGIAAPYQCDEPAISADGRFVVFESFADTLVAGDTNGTSDVFVRDRLAGTTTRVSVSTTGRQATGDSRQASISRDGRYVAYESAAPDLVRGDTNAMTDVFVRDRLAGTTTRISTSTAGRQANGSSWLPQISATGRYVAFPSAATNFERGDTNDQQDVFVRDRVAGTTTLVSLSSSGERANRFSSTPDISADGRFVTFSSDATNLEPAHTGEAVNVFIRDRRTGVTRSVAPAGSGGQPIEHGLFQPVLSDDASTVAFATVAPDLVPPDTTGYQVLIAGIPPG
ncbi:hypothetical protein AB0F81_39850 [Actinoplanes sp. NPDC024001]|uniref:TolB family protein n=1 Tax=Actinoplanes sp. NPDC024001 TaxID=3154598 RepID=UPI0033CDF3BA